MDFETLPQHQPEEPEQDLIANAPAGSDEQMPKPRAAIRLRSGMPLDEIARIGNPEHRAMALYSSGGSRTDPSMIKLADSVAVAEAGEWGWLVQTLLVPPPPKPKRVRQKKEPRSQEGQPNLWLDFAELSAEDALVPAPQVPEMTSTAPAADDAVVATDETSDPVIAITTA